MGGVIFDPKTIRSLDLDPIIPGYDHAILVEAFNQIIISKVTLPDFKRGIDIFQEKEDLLPFEEAKLFGHNAVHSMLGFLAARQGYDYMSEIRNDPELYEMAENAFYHESGAFLLKKYASSDDPLFTESGFHFYGDDLLKRMTNPFLRDEVQRICRDPVRKLLYDDRLFGTMREALKQDIRPGNIATGAAAGLEFILRENLVPPADAPVTLKNKDDLRSICEWLWQNDRSDAYKDVCIDMVWEGWKTLN
jgi:mannitol-1-phosphate 5-dehydrogenase